MGSPTLNLGRDARPARPGSQYDLHNAIQRSPAGVVNFQVYVKRETFDRAYNGPSYNIPPGAEVEVRANPNNAVGAAISTVSQDDAKNGGRFSLFANSAPQRFSVRNLNQIWVYSVNVGEGVYLTVLSQ